MILFRRSWPNQNVSAKPNHTFLPTDMQSRYQVSDMGTAAGPGANGAVLRIEPVRANRDDATYECVAENGVGDAVTAVATLTVFEGKWNEMIWYKMKLYDIKWNEVYCDGTRVTFRYCVYILA